MGRLINIRKVCAFALISCFINFQAQAQQDDLKNLLKSFPNEKVFLTTNSEILLAGQMLGYSTSIETQSSSGIISDIVYVELISDNKSVIFKHNLQLKNSMAYGDFFLPTNLKTGHYKLVSYTQWSLNNSKTAFDQTDIYIINPYLNASENDLKRSFSENEKYIEISQSPALDYKIKNQENGLKIITDAKVYQKRSKVQLEFQNTLDKKNFGTYSILVKKIDSLQVKAHNVVMDSTTNIAISQRIPEMRGELIQGTIVDAKTNRPVENQAVSLSIPGEDYVYKSTLTNEEGKFYFNLYENYQQEKAFIQVVSERRDDFKINIEQKDFDRYDELYFYPLKLNTNLKQYIIKNSIYNQVESAYYNIKSDSVESIVPAKSFYGDPDIIYVLDDFTRFSSVKETFIEVVQNAAIRNKGDGYQFLVYDFDDPFESLYKDVKPLLIMDGVQIQNENFVVDYNPNDIKSIALTKGIYSIGSVIYNGIIDIKLKRPQGIDFSEAYIEQIEIQRPISEKKYFKQNHEIAQERTPDFRTQLLWLPNFNLKTISQSIEFYTSDIPGFYLIELKGRTNDGKALLLNCLIEVSK